MPDSAIKIRMVTASVLGRLSIFSDSMVFDALNIHELVVDLNHGGDCILYLAWLR